MAELVRCEVIGPWEVADTPTGGIVELDSEKINVGALVYAGHVRVLPPEPQAELSADAPAKTDVKTDGKAGKGRTGSA